MSYVNKFGRGTHHLWWAGAEAWSKMSVKDWRIMAESLWEIKWTKINSHSKIIIFATVSTQNKINDIRIYFHSMYIYSYGDM